MSYEKETGLKPNGNLIFYGWAGILVAIAVFLAVNLVRNMMRTERRLSNGFRMLVLLCRKKSNSQAIFLLLYNSSTILTGIIQKLFKHWLGG